MDKITRKLMTMHKVSHPTDDVDKQYVSRKEGGRELVNIQDSIDALIPPLENYIQSWEKDWLHPRETMQKT